MDLVFSWTSLLSLHLLLSPSIHLVHTIYYLTDNYDVVYGINLYTVMSYLKMPQANAFLILHIKMFTH